MNTNATQICKKCHTEKSLTEYHKRGTSHQRICKTCRKAHVPSGNKRIVFLNPPELYAPLAARIEKLENRLRAKAASYASCQLEADDIYGAMVDEILFKSSPDDSDARILVRATWAAKACVRNYKTYSMMVSDEGSMSSSDDEGDLEITASPSQSAEDEFIKRENNCNLMSLIAELPKEHQTIITMLSLGHNQREIANAMNKSDQTISTAIKAIGAQLKSFGLSPLSFA